MNKFILSILLISFIACKQDSPTIDYTVLSGTIKNSTEKKLELTAFDFSEEIALNTDGSFTDSIQIPEDGYYFLKVGRSSLNLYLEKGKDIQLTMNGNGIDPSFTGELSAYNALLVSAAKIYREKTGNMQALYAEDEVSFIQKLKETQIAITEEINKQENISSTFKQQQIKNAEYGYAAAMENYENYHGYFGDDKEFKVSEDFKKELSDIDLNNEEAFRSSIQYRGLLNTKMNNQMMELYEDSNDYTKSLKESMKSISNPFIKNELLKGFSMMLLGPNDEMKANYDYIMENSNSEVYKKEYTDTYNKLKKLAKGQPSPEFVNYENHKGGETSLKDLRGKYVYIDVWATWCGPCKAEIPSLKQVEKDYHGKKIAFVSTSIDQAKDHDTWSKMVTDKELSGVQLMADKAWESDFVKNYQINRIPRFILVDPEGKIVTADAPRPSNPNLREMLDGLSL